MVSTELRARTARENAIDVAVVVGVAALVVISNVRGRELLARGVDIFLGFPPLLASWDPHIGPGTPFAIVVGIAAVAWGPALAERLGWRPLLWTGYAAALAWTVSLALVDGWQRGVVERLSSRDEYLNDVPKVLDIPAMLRTFSDHILTDQQVFWTTHVGAHPPGVFLLFLWLDRLGLGGGGAAGLFVMLIGASACVAVAVTLKALGHEEIARRALPFGVLLPGAVWVGVSADGMFAGVLAWGVALLAIGATGRLWVALPAGILLGYSLYLSYGLALGVVIPLAVIAMTRNWRAAGVTVVGALLVVAAFTLAGFWWFTGYADVRVIYALSIAQTRPYSYFVWTNLAAVAFAMGPAIVAALRRSLTLPRAALLLTGAALAAILVADISGMSKAEVERIWLPFVVWLVIPCALLPRARWWLAGQVALALAVNHVLFTVW